MNYTFSEEQINDLVSLGKRMKKNPYTCSGVLEGIVHRRLGWWYPQATKAETDNFLAKEDLEKSTET